MTLSPEEAALYIQSHTRSTVTELIAMMRRDPRQKLKRTFELPTPDGKVLYITVAMECR